MPPSVDDRQAVVDGRPFRSPPALPPDRHRLHRPFALTRPFRPGYRYCPVALSATIAPSSQQLHRPFTTSTNSWARFVAKVLLQVLGATEVERGATDRRRHHVPRRAALRDVVDRRERARNMVGLTEAGRDRYAQPDPAGREVQRRNERGRLEATQERRVVARVHDEAVGDEHEIELAALGLARDLLNDGE